MLTKKLRGRIGFRHDWIQEPNSCQRFMSPSVSSAFLGWLQSQAGSQVVIRDSPIPYLFSFSRGSGKSL